MLRARQSVQDVAVVTDVIYCSKCTSIVCSPNSYLIQHVLSLIMLVHIPTQLFHSRCPFLGTASIDPGDLVDFCMLSYLQAGCVQCNSDEKQMAVQWWAS